MSSAERVKAHQAKIAQALIALYDGAVAGEDTGSPIAGAADAEELFDNDVTFRQSPTTEENRAVQCCCAAACPLSPRLWLRRCLTRPTVTLLLR